MDQVIPARHGESELSVAGTVNGDPATACALTDLGEAQARRLGELLRETRLDLCVTSEFERVRRTADIALRSRDVPRLVLPELKDGRYGSFEGGTLTAYREWASTNQPMVVAPGGGESRSATVERYVRAYSAILARRERTILVAAHGLPIRYVLNALDDADPAPLVDQVAYAEPYTIGREDLERAVARLDRWARAPA